YLRGSNGKSAIDRSRIMKMLWDAVGSEFGGRHDLYEQNYLGQEDVHFMSTHRTALADGTMASLEELVENAMSDYDLQGWTDPDLVPAARVNSHPGALAARASSDPSPASSRRESPSSPPAPLPEWCAA